MEFQGFVFFCYIKIIYFWDIVEISFNIRNYVDVGVRFRVFYITCQLGVE